MYQTVTRDQKEGFELSNVLPGTYRLSAMRMNVTGNGGTENSQMITNRTLHIAELDVRGIQLTVGPMSQLRGRFVLPEGRSMPTGFMVFLELREPGDPQTGSVGPVGSDGTFVLGNCPSGDYSVFVGSLSTAGDMGDLYIAAIRLGDVDALAEGVSLMGTPPGLLEIVLKPNGGLLQATVKDDRDGAMPAAQVWLVPDGPNQQKPALYGECRADPKGSCRITGITPGDYHAYAFPTEVALDRRDPDAIKPLEKHGKAVKFAEGDKQAVELVAIPVQ